MKGKQFLFLIRHHPW